MGYHRKATPTALVRRHCKNLSHVTHTQNSAYTRVQVLQSDAKFGLSIFQDHRTKQISLGYLPALHPYQSQHFSEVAFLSLYTCLRSVLLLRHVPRLETEYERWRNDSERVLTSPILLRSDSRSQYTMQLMRSPRKHLPISIRRIRLP